MKRAYEMGHKGVLFAARYDKVGMPRLVDDYWRPPRRDRRQGAAAHRDEAVPPGATRAGNLGT
jgi:hypothetical protein